MSTADCKKLIEKSAKEQGFAPQSKWKRTRKYKEGELVLRDFENQNHDKITVAEDKNGILSIYQFEQAAKISDTLLKTLDEQKLLTELLRLPLDILKNRHADLEDFLDSVQNWIKFSGPMLHAIDHYIKTNDISLIADNVPYLESKEDLPLIFCSIMEIESYNETHKDAHNFVRDIAPDTVGVIYDKENVFGEVLEQEGIHYVLLSMGGDWEIPVIAYIYWSEKEGRLKGFFPMGEGNLYNEEVMTAYGSEMDYGKHGLKYGSTEYNKLQQRCEDRFEEIYENEDKYEKKARKHSFEQFKKQLLAQSLHIKP